MRPCTHPDDRFVVRCRTARRLDTTIAELRQQQPDVDEQVAEIRNGDDRLLLGFVRRVQEGDRDAANLVLWALLPRLCGYIRTRLALEDWRIAVDELLALLYLTICDVPSTERPEALAVKLVQRARRRYERFINPRIPEPTEGERLSAALPVVNDVERHVLARLELEQLLHAVADGAFSRPGWAALVATRLEPPRQPPSGPERMAVMRIDRKLAAWRNVAA
jgi:hypothetical protein